jgi:hypothetical protein
MCGRHLIKIIFTNIFAPMPEADWWPMEDWHIMKFYWDRWRDLPNCLIENVLEGWFYENIGEITWREHMELQKIFYDTYIRS